MNIGEYIKQLRTQYEYSQEQLGAMIGVQRAAVQKWESGKVKNLKRDTVNKLSQIFNVPVSAFVSEKEPAAAVKIPVLGYVRAGIPLEATQEILGYEEISQADAKQDEYFALSIKGDSMEPKISEGDVVIVRKQCSVENGEIAVVLIGGNDATVKKFYKNDSGIKLISTNPIYDPFFFTPKETAELPVTIIGKVVELRAKF
ncbi:MAG: XRE family transcriptional regulator [Faecalibacterium sp.]|nr:XRE family transcriptional regulator [Ruminococcus sp.]MCM1486478.1 XRE family transcriptional regulator [Faecalibacterium sp.]